MKAQFAKLAIASLGIIALAGCSSSGTGTAKMNMKHQSAMAASDSQRHQTGLTPIGEGPEAASSPSWGDNFRPY